MKFDKYLSIYFPDEVVSQTEFDTLHDMFDGVMDEADLDGENSFDKLFSQMKLMKGVYDNNYTHELNYNKANHCGFLYFFTFFVFL